MAKRLAQARARAAPIRYLSAIALGIGVTACQSPPLVVDQPFQVGEPLKLGVLVPETGPYSRVGTPMVTALLQLRDTVNACGGINRAPVTLAIHDIAADEDGGETGMRYLVNEVGVHAVVAALAPPVELDILAIALERNVSVISPTVTAELTPKRRSPLKGWGQLSLSEVQQGRALAKLAIARDWRVAQTLVSDTAGGRQFEQAFLQTFEAKGGSAGEPMRYSSLASSAEPRLGGPARPDVTPRDVASAMVEVDVIVASLDDPQGYRLLRTALEAASTPAPVLLSQSMTLPVFGESRRPVPAPDQPYILNQAAGVSPLVNTDGLQVLRARWQRLGLPWGRYVPQAWDAAALLVLAAEAAGRNGRLEVQSELKHVSNPPGVSVTEVCTGLVHLREGVMINYQGASSSVDLATSGQLVTDDQYRLWRILEAGQLAWQSSIALP